MATANIPAELAAPLAKASTALQAAAGDTLVSLTVYGSAVRGVHQPGVSDVNVLIVLRAAPRATLAAVGTTLTETDGKCVITPYLVLEHELPLLADAFPTRVFDMKRGYVVLHGSDALASLKVDTTLLAVRAGQELLNILMRFRHMLLRRNDNDGIAAALQQAMPAALKTMRTLVYLKTGRHLDDRAALVVEAEKALGLPAASWRQLVRWRRGELDFAGVEWEAAADAFLQGLTVLAEGAS